MKQKHLEANKKESYTYLEMLMVLVFGTFSFFPSLRGFRQLRDLWVEKFYLKFIQRIVLLLIGFAVLYFSVQHSMNQREKELQEEMDKIDISDWEKFHGYDK